MTYRSTTVQRLLAACGIAGPPVYALVLAVLGSLQPGYSHVEQSMSELGERGAPHAVYMNTLGFPLLGLLLAAFAVGLYLDLGRGRSSAIGCALIAASGISLVMTGIFPCDPGCVDVTATGTAHSVFAAMAAFTLIVAPFALLPALGSDARWRGYALLTLIMGIIAAALSAVYGFAAFQEHQGAMQRISMGASLLWVVVIAARLLQVSQPED